MKLPRREAGQAMVEYALTAAIFFILLLFILDGSRILWSYATISQAVAAGARYGIVHGARSSQPVGPGNYAALQKVVVNNAIGLDPAMLVVKVSWENESNVPGNRITVEAVYRTRGVTGLFWPGQTFALYSSSSMIIQN